MKKIKGSGEKNIIIGVTGGVAIYKACEVVRSLKKQGGNVTVIMTREAEEFITPLLFQSLSGNKVYRGLFDLPDVWDIEHISLAEQADVVAIIPATANIIGKLASGLCDDLLTCVVTATQAPVVIYPSMNAGMYSNFFVQENIKRLKVGGITCVGPREGELACGKKGIGCLAEVDTIVKTINSFL